MWIAKNIVMNKVPRDLPNGGKAMNFSFSSDIYKDDVFHHSYSEPNLGSPSNINKIIKDHLNFWEFIDGFQDSQPIDDIDNSPIAQAQPTKEQIDAEILSKKKSDLIQAKQDLDLGIIDQTAYDTQLTDLKTTISLNVSATEASINVK